ncbi:MAG: alpha-galactosidase [Candidatus Aminicenantes bacterium]|nr:alpha-galactosidase [Candidatus Aminicenantes bacterium]
MKRHAGYGRTVIACVVTVFVAAASLSSCRRSVTPTGEPANGPAKVDIGKKDIGVRYDGKAILDGSITAGGAGFTAKVNVFRTGEAVSQAVLLEPRDKGGRVRLEARIVGGPESFACEADRRDRGPVVVRHVSGESRSGLNRAVYDRGRDWVLSVDAGPRAAVIPVRAEGDRKAYDIVAEGAEIVLRFRPRYYQVHRGLDFFEPWTYRIWPDSVAGWISWFAFRDEVTEEDIVRTADTLAETLLPFGYDLLQIDDGYQSGEGRPDLWLTANAKFPRGLGFLPGYIKSRGLRPGIWTNVAFKQADYAAEHQGWFVTDARGEPARGNWVEFSLDASVPEAVDAVVRPVYRGLRDMGWEYFKVDALRHLRYEGYNAHADHFRKAKRDLAGAFRSYVEAVREEVGRDVFVLGCWGIRPELVGLIDGCRVGTDGFSYAGLAQFNSWNNVVWRNDPDHIELDENRYRSTLVTSLTGAILLLTDKPELYRTEAGEPARRAAPVLWTVPGQVFDVDASRSGELGRVAAEVSGSGPRAFDASLRPACDLFLLEIDRPFEAWSVLGRTGESAREIGFADLGLDPDVEYYVFEFWSKRLLGSFRGSFAPGPLDPVFRSQALAIRERTPHPQLLATSRHVSCGGVDLDDVRWTGEALEGTSRVVAGDPYEIFLTEPKGYRLARFESPEAPGAAVVREGGQVRIKWLPAVTGPVRWLAVFEGP